MTPGVDQLTLPLPGEQTVIYEPSLKSAKDVLISKETTQIVEYFDANVLLR